MRRRHIRSVTVAGLSALALMSSAAALASPELAEKSACLNCHQVDKKMVGPSFTDVAAKYQSRQDAVAYLAEKIAKGSSGVWGAIPMPPNAKLSADDARALAGWIAGLKK